VIAPQSFFCGKIIKMQEPNILLHENHRIAFEELVKQDSENIVKRTKRKRAFDRAGKYIIGGVVPNVSGALIGGLTGGLEGALEGMKQVSVGAVPYIFLLNGLADYLTCKAPLDNINSVIKGLKHNTKKNLNYVENRGAMVFNSFKHMAICSLLFYGTSLLTEYISGIDIEKGLVASTGLFLGLINSGIDYENGKKWKQRILDYVKKNPIEIDEKRGERLKLEKLESIIDVALDDPEKINKINLASSEKKFRGIGGALGYLGLIDSLGDEHRDPTKIKPNVSLSLESEWLSNRQKYPQFKFGCKRRGTKTETILKLAQIVNARSKGVELNIHPMFLDAPLEKILSEPYEQLITVYMGGFCDSEEYFKICYDFEDGVDDEVEITINSRDKLGLVLDVFKQTYGRPLKDKDFDSEILELLQKEEERDSDSQFLQELHRNNEFYNFKPKENNPLFDFTKPNKEQTIKEKPEQPLKNINSLTNLVLEVYNKEKERILPCRGFPSLGIALEGAVYLLTPLEDRRNKKEKGVEGVLRFIGSPLRTMNSLVKEREILPSLRRAEVMAQISGITRENIYEIIRELGNKIPRLKVSPFTKSKTSYTDFWEFKKILNYCLIIHMVLNLKMIKG
jgi:hypothetical protein